MTDQAAALPECFIAMPIATRAEDLDRFDGDQDHWLHVMESLFVHAIEAAGYDPVRPVAKGAHMIHAEIMKNLSRCDLVLVDLSSHNPNVFFELGVRTALDKPVALVNDQHTTLPFDTGGINTHHYDSRLRGWTMQEQISDLRDHILASAASCAGHNPLWQRFGLTIRAEEPDVHVTPLEAKVDVLTSDIAHLQNIMASEMQRRGRSEAMSQRDRMGHFLQELRQYWGPAVLERVKFSVSGEQVELADPSSLTTEQFSAISELADRYDLRLTYDLGTATQHSQMNRANRDRAQTEPHGVGTGRRRDEPVERRRRTSRTEDH